jgi:hypothetical protein
MKDIGGLVNEIVTTVVVWALCAAGVFIVIAVLTSAVER